MGQLVNALLIAGNAVSRKLFGVASSSMFFAGFVALLTIEMLV